MADAVETFIGWTALGMGAVIVYGAVRNVPVFGKSGLVNEALTTGALPHVPARVIGSSSGGGVTGGKATNAPAKLSQFAGDQATSLSREGIHLVTGANPAPPSHPLSFWQQTIGYRPSNSSGGWIGGAASYMKGQLSIAWHDITSVFSNPF